MGAQGVTTVNFGAFPGSSYAGTVITGQAGILASPNSLAEAWLWPITTADHMADEHLVEPIIVTAGDIVPGTGFTIHAVSGNVIGEPIQIVPHETSIFTASATTIGIKLAPRGQLSNYRGGYIPMVFGLWTVAWVWN